MSTVKQIQTGYIVKEGSNVKSWKKRWFVFTTDGNISYYTNRQETCKKGEVDMRHAIKAIKVNGKKLMIEIHFDSSRVFRLKFDDEEVEERWYKSFIEFIEDNKTSQNGFSRYEEIDLNNFNIGNTIMQTDKGSVQTVIYTRTQIKYSMKTLLKLTLNSEEIEYIESIHNSLKLTECPYLCRTCLSFQSENLHFVMNEYPTKKLSEIMNSSILPIPRVKFYATELLLAINALHKCNYIHMEINPETVLITDDGHIFLTTPVGLRASYKCGYNYFAPELLEKKQPTAAVDYWSYGILLFAMAFGEAPFFDTNPSTVCKKIISEPINFPYNTFPEVESFVTELLVKDPSKRNCDFEALKLRPFFVGINFDQFQKKEVSPQ
uniref:PH domain containing protein kinase, putative n=1 Tax=Entamoeba histolytica TaxID=5759 RepID=S0AWB5_ENTHI|nr:PH domain containing protein kinase, putative [Entamoeba histolytica]